MWCPKLVNVGDIIIIPAGTPHGWSNIPDHVDYLSFRPSQSALTAGYVESGDQEVGIRD